MKSTAAVISLLVAFSASAALGQASSRGDFEELCKIWKGRWVADNTLLADSPGIGKKGEKVRVSSEVRIIADGNAILQTGYAGNGTFTRFIAYDASSKQIKILEATSAGNVWAGVFSKKDGKWGWEGTGSRPDGSKFESNGTIAISDGGDIHTWSATITIEGDKATPSHVENVYRRVNK